MKVIVSKCFEDMQIKIHVFLNLTSSKGIDVQVLKIATKKSIIMLIWNISIEMNLSWHFEIFHFFSDIMVIKVKWVWAGMGS